MGKCSVARRAADVSFCAIAVALALSAAPNAAHAQNQEAEADTGDVIIVTATRRAEDVQEIPIAVTAVSGTQLDEQSVFDVTALGQVAPSFSTSSAQNAGGTVVFRIRGVGTTSNNIGFESAVGVFVDGVYQSRPGVALSEFVDIERAEVLRGPQGTLFGRNTSAGALNITTKRPDLDEFGGFANATYGNFDLMNVQGTLNAPIIPGKLAVRLTGAWRERDGFVDIVDAQGNKFAESNEINRYLLRGQIGFGTDGGVTGRIIADFSKNTANCCSPVEILRSPLETGGALAAVGLGPRGGMAGPIVAESPFDQATAEEALSNRIATLNSEPTADIETWGISAEVEVPISLDADLIYIGSYREFSAFETADSDGSGLDAFNNFGTDRQINTMTHELRVQGEAFGGRLSWLVGGFYSDEDIDQSVNLALGPDFGELIGATLLASTGGAFGPNPLTILSGGIDPDGTSVVNAVGQDSQSWSIFTHNVLEVVDGFDLTVGLRWSDEAKDGFFDQTSVNNSLCPAIANNVLAGGVPPGLVNAALGFGCFAFVSPADLPQAAVLPLPRTFSGVFEDEELIYTFKLGYDFGDVNAYASFTHGYKAGGFNLDSTAAVSGADPSFASEEVDAYEIGLKGRFLDGALTANLAVFHQEFTDFQVLEFTGLQFETFNIPVAETTGFELESVLRPGGGVTINASLTYTDARYPEDCAADTDPLRVRNLCGFSLTNAPQIVSIFGANWERDISSDLQFFANAQARLEGDRRTSTQGRAVPVTEAQLGATALLPFDVQDGFVRLNLRAGIGSQDGSWAIEGWVTNLTNEITRGVTFNTTLRSGARSAFPQEPRMYGVTVRGAF